ncbi:MAG TPA: urate hydroxylase PuuD [Caulobacter sp.]|nr:urate hydroxylase PuuD [Caulobacter sp.]
MTALLSNFRNTIIVSVILALIMVFAYQQTSDAGGHQFGEAVLRWLHVFFGILWIGLLYYFNFVQIRKMPDIPAELKPAVSKYIAPEALFWFRWAALLTWVVGVILAWNRGYLVDVLSLGATSGFENKGHTLLGIGVWLATIMFLNVWGFIWPAQKIALGIKEGYDADAKAAAGKKAMLFSRINTLLSIPMLTSMTMNQTLFG